MKARLKEKLLLVAVVVVLAVIKVVDAVRGESSFKDI